MDSSNHYDGEDEETPGVVTTPPGSPSTKTMNKEPSLLGADASTSIPGMKEEPEDVQLFNSVRFGMRSNVIRLLSRNKDLVKIMDPQGYSCVHWAAKRGDVDMLQTLVEFGAPVNIPTQYDAMMHPIHWAASEGKIASIRFLLEHRVDINSQDGNGCTPVIIAAQHNHAASVIFFIKNGADMTLTDTNGDTALHWAAYKGYEELVGLLSYFMPRQIDMEDSFGQTPLHLSALRGNAETVEYLVVNCHADTSKKDRNGLTAVELSAKKKQLKVEWLLRSLATGYNLLATMRSIGFTRMRNPRLIMYALFGFDDREMANWPWRIVFLSNAMGSWTTITLALSEHLGDLSMLHLINVMVQSLWWIFFWLCLAKSPSFVQDPFPSSSSPSSSSSSSTSSSSSSSSSASSNLLSHEHTYENALEIIGKALNEDNLPHICNTCHVCRPLRSKHCKFQRRCVHKFDHFCPFVGNTVGRDNYKYFIGLLFMHTICFFFWIITSVYYMWRATVSWSFLIFFVYTILWEFMILSLLSYHLQLISKNFSTNEHINLGKYKYLRNAFSAIDNPFDRGTFWENFKDALFPSEQVFYTREEALSYRSNNSSFSKSSSSSNQGAVYVYPVGGAGHQSMSHSSYDHSHSHGHGHGHGHGHHDCGHDCGHDHSNPNPNPNLSSNTQYGHNHNHNHNHNHGHSHTHSHHGSYNSHVAEERQSLLKSSS